MKRRNQVEKTRFDERLENVPKHVKKMRRALKKMGVKIVKAFSPKFRELVQKIEAIEKEDSGERNA